MSASLYSKYWLEREDVHTLEKENGFLTYKISGEECYLKDIYVDRDFRRSNLAFQMADEVAKIAKEKGCTYLTGTVCPSAQGADASLQVVIAYGMKLHSAQNNLIIFKKDIVSWEV